MVVTVDKNGHTVEYPLMVGPFRSPPMVRDAPYTVCPYGGSYKPEMQTYVIEDKYGWVLNIPCGGRVEFSADAD